MIKKELQMLKELNFREISPLCFCHTHWELGYLFVQYDLNTLGRKIYAKTLHGLDMRKEDFEAYMIFKMGLKRLESRENGYRKSRS